MIRKQFPDYFINSCFFILRKTFGWLIRLIWIKKVTGLSRIPKKGAAIVVFNHQSYFDFFCFLAVSPRSIHFLAAEKFFDHKIWRILMKITGQIHVKRTYKDKRQVHSTVYDHLTREKIIGIFPEGTRAANREEIGKAFSGVAKYAIKGGVPIIPIGIKGTYDIMSRYDAKPKLRKIVEIHIGLPISLSEYRPFKLNRKAYEIITHRLMLTLSRLSEKSYPHAPKHLIHFPHA